ncbi:MAG: hypothetical protein ACTSRI_09235 [Promethearchaeota archaeon]
MSLQLRKKPMDLPKGEIGAFSLGSVLGPAEDFELDDRNPVKKCYL